MDEITVKNEALKYFTKYTIIYLQYGNYIYYMSFYTELAATLRGSRPGVQSASLIMTSLMTS